MNLFGNRLRNPDYRRPQQGICDSRSRTLFCFDMASGDSASISCAMRDRTRSRSLHSQRKEQYLIAQEQGSLSIHSV